MCDCTPEFEEELCSEDETQGMGDYLERSVKAARENILVKISDHCLNCRVHHGLSAPANVSAFYVQEIEIWFPEKTS